MMYQTPQGMVYAAPQANAAATGLPEGAGYVLNLPQTPTLAIPQPAATTPDGQQQPAGEAQT